MNKIINNIKKNKVYYIAFIVSYILLYLIMNNVVRYADDYVLELESMKSFDEIIEYFKYHYMNWGGGYTPLIAIFIFKLGFTSWKIINTLLITIILFAMAKLISKNKKRFLVNYGIVWLLFYSISILVARESIYWLDGSLSYVVCTFELFLFIYMLYTRFIQKKSGKFDYITLPLVAFFSGWSDAQSTAITLVVTILFSLYYFLYKKEKFNLKYLLFVSFAIIGSLIFFLSPGNSVRMQQAYPDFANAKLISKAMMNVGTVSSMTYDYSAFEFQTMPLFMFLFSYLLCLFNLKNLKDRNKNSKKLLNISLVIQFAFLLTTLFVKYLDIEFLKDLLFRYNNIYDLAWRAKLSITDLIPYAFLFMFIFANLVSLLIYFLEGKDKFLLLIYLCVYGSQYSMILAPTFPYRAELMTIFFLIFGIVYLINYFNEKKFYYGNHLLAVSLYFNLEITIVLFLVSNFVFDKDKYRYVCLLISALPLLTIPVINYYDLYTNYEKNKKIYNENEQVLLNYEEGNDVLYFKKYYNNNYSFSEPVDAEWIQTSIRDYYKIPYTVKFEYEKD